MKQKKSGFTLIELLGVILILTALVMIVWPNISNSVNNKQSDVDNLTLKIIEDATKLYISDKKDNFPKVDGNVYCIAMKQLINEEYLKENIEYKKEDISNEKTMKVFYKNGFNYVLVDNKDCTEIPKSFAEDSWETIAENVRAGNLSRYNVGDTKEIKLDGFTNEEAGSNGLFTIRIANKSTPDECNTQGFSQTACGFVIEFEDIIAKHMMKEEGNTGGYPASLMYQYVKNDIYNSLPEKLKNVIIETIVVSGHESGKEENYSTKDKLYLLSTKEIYGEAASNDSVKETRQLDYYNNLGVTNSNYSGAIKKFAVDASYWWLRSAQNNSFYDVDGSGKLMNSHLPSTIVGVSVAFRIG